MHSRTKSYTIGVLTFAKRTLASLTKSSLKISVDVKFTDKTLSNTWMRPRMIRRIMQIKEGKFGLGGK